MGPSSLSRMLIVGSLCFAALTRAASAQKMDARVIDRRSSDSAYNYHVPTHAASATSATADCHASSSSSSSSANCSDSAAADDSASSSPTYLLTGTTLSLLLPGDRIAIVNCVSKSMFKIDYVNRRSCRIPETDALQTDFSAKSVKLKWAENLDARKLKSETYRLVAILPRP